MSSVRRHLILLFLAAGLHSASAFSLLGPFEPWMTTNLGFNNYFVGVTDIGGPKNIGEGYRWNIPVITYGYDQSFLEYFGSNGVNAVESAIQIFNNLPPASETNLDNYPLFAAWPNYHASQLGLYDLKTSALGLIIEQLGLASPTRFAFTLHDFTDFNDYSIVTRSFDPVTFVSSPFVNGILYTNEIYVQARFNIAECVANAVDPLQQFQNPSTVADYVFNFDAFHYSFTGAYYKGLTRDDVGGLYYLYSTNNFALESLIPGIRGTGTNSNNYVNTAVRPGVGKITFQRLDYDPHCRQFLPLTNFYVDSYLTNGILQQQSLERFITQPDILFAAGHLGYNLFSRTGASNWVNNGGSSQNGPGVIEPPVAINFARLGPLVYNGVDPALPPGPGSVNFQPSAWASFDGTTNAAVVYPANLTTNFPAELSFWSYGNPNAQTFLPPPKITSWSLAAPYSGVFLLQTSSNLSDWFTITTVTNLGQDLNYFDYTFTNISTRFFRIVPQ